RRRGKNVGTLLGLVDEDMTTHPYHFLRIAMSSRRTQLRWKCSRLEGGSPLRIACPRVMTLINPMKLSTGTDNLLLRSVP
ncbi:hypothetical protein, partial [Phytoactinopolyspora endophytica]|uniref:hypothetical protein n=1 Tax=Phytoactinopolyspora endophytica TaxID=1642495 RepID=UPI00197C1A4A